MISKKLNIKPIATLSPTDILFLTTIIIISIMSQDGDAAEDEQLAELRRLSLETSDIEEVPPPPSDLPQNISNVTSLNSSTSTYENADIGIRFLYPSDWGKIVELSEGVP